MPRLIRVYIVQVIIGFGLAGLFVGLLMYANVGNLRHLVVNTSGGGIALFMFWVLNGIVFAGVQFGIAIMRMADDETTGGGKGQCEPVVPGGLVRVSVGAQKVDR